MPRSPIWLSPFAVLAAACNGNIGAGWEAGTPPPGSDPEAVACFAGQAGPAPLRRLTRDELRETLVDLLGGDQGIAGELALDASVGPFKNNTHSPVTALFATQYMEGAAKLSSTPGVVASVVPCDPDDTGMSEDEETTCVAGFLDGFGARAFRRPLTIDEKGRYIALFTKMRVDASYTFAEAMRVTLDAMLQSPTFLYHVELPATKDGAGEAGSGVERVGAYELASRLSYFLWGTMPDDVLFDAAKNGALDTDEGIETEVRRMLAHDRAKAGLRHIYAQWLNLEKLPTLTKDPTVYPGFDASTADALRKETEAFVDDVVWNGEGDLATLLTATHTFVNPTVAGIYGVAEPTGDALVRTELDPNERAGILTQPSMLAINAHTYQTSPVFRGKFVRERLLCSPLPSPPGDVDVTPPTPNPNLTTRERFAKHKEDPTCASCHLLMDPIGLGFEKYDPVGRFRTDEYGLPIDDSGEVIASLDVDGPFNGGVALAQRLAGSKQVAACTTTQLATYALGREPSDEDVCSIDGLTTDLVPSALDVREMLVAITKTDAFKRRKAVPVEACQ